MGMVDRGWRRVAAVVWTGALVGAVAALAGTVACAPQSETTGPSGPATSGSVAPSPSPGPTSPVRPDHIVVVVFENKAASDIDGSPSAPTFNSLIANAAVLTGSRAVAHPSEPNYLALFSGSTQGVTDDRCPLDLGDRPNLGRQVLDAGLTFTGYSEGLPLVGFAGCSSGRYAAKHSPWVHFDNLPPAVNQPATSFPSDFAKLPTVAFLIPDLCHDMHDCSVATGDSWLHDHVDAYAAWARTHNSLLIVTFDEDDNTADNRILTFVVGAGVRPGRYPQPVNHYGVLATVEDLLGLPRVGAAATEAPVAGTWR